MALKKTMELGKSVTQLNTTIWSIYQDRQSNFWFGSRENGLFFYNGKDLRQYTTEDGLVSNEVRGIQEDSKGTIFVETEYGVSKFDGQSFTSLEIKNDDAPTDGWQLNPDDLWFRIGFDKKGPYRFDGEYLHYLKLPKSPQEANFYKNVGNTSIQPYGLYSIYKDSKGFMWFGTASLGVCRFDGKNLNWHYEDQLQTTPSGGDFGSRAVFEDQEGLFWINNTRFRYAILDSDSIPLNYKKEKGIGFINDNQQTEFPFFQSIKQSNDGDLWLATYGNGVWRNTGKELIHYPIKDGQKKIMLFSIYKDQRGVLWLGTFNAGVYKFNGTSFEKFELQKN